ncbi:hypothetical protein Ddye_013406 [Dipteronia dyeriana]|uniref:Uncharacterized protein n=1 Tax=Dipteronia dyeriana TaxID=168575 RepID=A0AAD9X652_9ROSI|nr:hypothetical protein Ddye_013406 [Dipteronia dyeriana]
MVTIRNFNSFVKGAEVLNILMSCMSFTWTNLREIAAWARLDHFLFSLEILNWFPKMVQRGFSRSVSNHNPIGIGEPKTDRGLNSFHFFNWWTENKELTTEAIRGWKGYLVRGSKSQIHKAKMKASKMSIKKWLELNKKQNLSLEQLGDYVATLDKKVESKCWPECHKNT